MEERTPVGEQEIGVIVHYWGRLGVAGVHLTEPVDVGDPIHVLGHTTDFRQDIESMQIEHRGIYHANAGEDVAIHVVGRAREHDRVYRPACEDVGEGENEL